MVEKDAGRTSRAVVLGGGGVTGIAWEVGVLAGLRAAGLDLTRADLVLRTSAGSFVGAALASGYDLEKLFEEQAEDSGAEVATSASAELMDSWIAAHVEGNGDARKVAAAFGRIALAAPEPVPGPVRRRVVGARLVTTEWPDRLKITVEAIGPNIYDPTRRGPAASAGRRQAGEAAAAVAELWN
jgi:NTE family protein